MHILILDMFVSMQCVTHIKTFMVVLHGSCSGITVTVRYKCVKLGTGPLDQ